jgi:hypothetical protein
VTRDLLIKIGKYYKVQASKMMMTSHTEEDNSWLVEEAVKLEDEIHHVFGVNRATLTKAIIEYALEP